MHGGVARNNLHCVKSLRIRSFFGPFFPAFGLNTERYSISDRFQSEYEKIRARKTLNTDFLHTVLKFIFTEFLD